MYLIHHHSQQLKASFTFKLKTSNWYKFWCEVILSLYSHDFFSPHTDITVFYSRTFKCKLSGWREKQKSSTSIAWEIEICFYHSIPTKAKDLQPCICFRICNFMKLMFQENSFISWEQIFSFERTIWPTLALRHNKWK